jgi:hypothetical protein
VPGHKWLYWIVAALKKKDEHRRNEYLSGDGA